MKMKPLFLATALIFTATPSQAFFGGLEKELKKLEQAVQGNKSAPQQAAPASRGFGGFPGMPSMPGAMQQGQQPGQQRGMFDITAELDKETRRGPVGRLQLGFDSMASTFGAHTQRVPADDPRAIYIGQIVRTVAAASRMPYAYQGWTPILVYGPGDASATSGGLIKVETGLLEVAESEDELAAVLAHEIAHIELDHVGYDFKAKKSAEAFDEMQRDPSNPRRAALGQAQLIYSVETMRGYSVQAESEADARAAEILRDAGYNPYALLRVIERVTEEKAGEIKGIRYAYIENLKYQGASASGTGNKYPKGRATLLLDVLKRMDLSSDPGDSAQRTERFNRTIGAYVAQANPSMSAAAEAQDTQGQATSAVPARGFAPQRKR